MLFQLFLRSFTDHCDLRLSQAAHIHLFSVHLVKKDLHTCRACKNDPLISIQFLKCLIQSAIILNRYCTDRRQLQNLGTFLTEKICCLWNMLSWSCDQNLPACQRKLLIPGKFVSQRTYLSHNNNGRCLYPLSVHLFLEGTYSSNHPLLSCCCSFLKNCCRHIRIHAACKKPFADILQCCNSHEKHQCSLCPGQCLKIYIILLPCTFMSCNNM